MELLWQVYGCDWCKRLGLGFERPDSAHGFFKFPPTIGATGAAPLLFVGINPRRSESNKGLHDAIMKDPAAFEALSRNWVGGQRYIRAGGEPHYQDHMRVVRGVFGPRANFEDHAAASELLFCATERAKGLPCATSPCANTYFERVFDQVKPKFVICVGKGVLGYFQAKWGGGDCRLCGVVAKVAYIAHPNDPGTTATERRRLLAVAVAEVAKAVKEPVGRV
jgi:hypothetical protein